MGQEGLPSVLYVDDEESNLTSFNATFRRHFNVLVADSGQEALKILQSNDVHVVITDHRMPSMNGVQLLDEVVKRYPKPTRILISAYTDLSALQYAVLNGLVFDYLRKPWNEEEIVSAVREAYAYYFRRLKFGESRSDKKMILDKLRAKITGLDKGD